MGSKKGRRTSGSFTGSSPISRSPTNSTRPRDDVDAGGGLQARIKLLSSVTLGNPGRGEEGSRTVALTEEDFRKSGFRSRELVVIFTASSSLVAGMVTPFQSATLRPGNVGISSSAVRSLNCVDGTRALVLPLVETSVSVLSAVNLTLVLENGGRNRVDTELYLSSLTSSRKRLFERAVRFSVEGMHTRQGDSLSVSFEGTSHNFKVKSLSPPNNEGGVEENGTLGIDGAVFPATEMPRSPADPSPSLSMAMSSLGMSDAPRPVPPHHPPQTPTRQLTVADEFSPIISQGSQLSAVTVKSAPRDSTSSYDTTSTQQTPQAKLEAFYRHHNPEKLDGLEIILDKYKGREPELFVKLEKKYGPGSLEAAGVNTSPNTENILEVSSNRCLKGEDRHSTPLKTNKSHQTVYDASPTVGTTTSGYTTPQEIRKARSKGTAGPDRNWCGEGMVLWKVTSATVIEITANSAISSTKVSNGNTLGSRGVVRTDGHSSIGLEREGHAGTRLSRDVDATAVVGASELIEMGGTGVGRREVMIGLRDSASETEEQWSSVGGLGPQIQQLKEAIQLPLLSPEVLRRYGVRPPRGVLLHGPPGTGKTTLARAAAAACGCHVIVVNGPELVSRFVGESEAALRSTFWDASRKAPCLIVFDEIDSLCPRRDQANSEGQRRIVSTLLALLDGVDIREQVVVIACTNRPQALDPALRRPGRLDSEVEIGVPDERGREDILRVLLRKVPYDLGGEDFIPSLASRTHGFVGADLQLLVKEAALRGIRRGQTGAGVGDVREWMNDGKVTTSDKALTVTANCADLKEGVASGRGSGVGTAQGVAASAKGGVGGGFPTLTRSDFEEALPFVSPSGLREVAVEVPKVQWEDIGGMSGVKQSLREVVEWPLKFPQAFARMGISPPRGVLLYGPPGCSKTLMARALATESGMNFLAVKGPELLSKWLGESERALQSLFKRARAAAPTIVFFDEVDALACKRGGGTGAGATERVLTQLLTELDGIQLLKRVVVVAATNRPDVIDPALLRPGRLDRLVYVPPPDLASREEILRISLGSVPTSEDVDSRLLADKTAGFSGAEVVALCREASICALEEDRSAERVCQRHLLLALQQIRPQITPSVLAAYDAFRGAPHTIPGKRGAG